MKSSVPIATEILVKAGVRRERVKKKLRGGVHPGGSAAIGEVVDHNLETQIANCYVCDASVLPVAPGLPPILTILALSKRLARRVLGSA
jgi:choline dehydrogenase-like flavoprotein